MHATVNWAGGVIPPDQPCQCNSDHYACTSGSGTGDWANGVKYYQDDQKDQSYALTQVYISIYGSFDCNSNQAVTVMLNDQLVETIEIPANQNSNCNLCRNCLATDPVVVSSQSYPKGFPYYITYAPNSISIVFPPPITPNQTHFCLSQAVLTLVYNETAQIPDSSGELTVPPWFWTLVGAAGVIVLVLVLTLFILWRRSVAAGHSSSGGTTSGSKGWGAYRPLSPTEYLDPRQLDDISIDFKEFTVDCEIGHGSFGLVHKALWRGTEVAIKRLPRDSMDQQVLLEFMKEAFIMRQLRHPNVLQVLGVCLEPPCIVMEYMPRGSLFQLIHNPSVTLDYPIVRKLAIEICRGMAYLHGCTPPLIHRDLKPHNLLVDELWRVKVCDFGLSRFWEAKKDMTACGTPAYAAPEVLRNSAYSVSADVYSFAMVLWELITRQSLYPGIPPFQIIFTVGTQGLRPTLPPTCHPGIARVIQDCWAEDPTGRPSFVDLADRIQQLPDE